MSGRGKHRLPRNVSSSGKVSCTSQTKREVRSENYVPKGNDGTPGLYFNKDSELACRLVQNIKEFRSKSAFFTSPAWARNRHVSTLVSHFLRVLTGHPGKGYERKYLRAEDGGTLALDMTGGSKRANNGGPLILMIAGLGGSSDDSYTKSMAAAAAKKGWKSAVLCMRGTGNGPVTSARFFSARRGSTEDVRFVVSHLKDQYPDTPIVGVGWSLGGCIMANALLEQDKLVEADGSKPKGFLSAAAILAAPFDLNHSTKVLDQWPSTIYDTRLGKGLVSRCMPHIEKFRADFQEHFDSKGKPLDFAKIVSSKRVRDFDEHVTAPFFGHDSATDYYSHSSPAARINGAAPEVPMLVVSALDDPIVGSAGIPFKAARENPNLFLAATEHGGHLGWVEGLSQGLGYDMSTKQDAESIPPSWTERAVLGFFQHACCTEETDRHP